MKSLLKILSFLIFIPTLFSQSLYETQIIPFDGLGSDFFGVSVATSDSFLFVTSLRYSNHIENSVYVYKIEDNNYNFEYKIFPSDIQSGTFGMLFGGELLYSDGQLFVGARNRKINDIPVGAVYLFEYENDIWVEKQIILPSQPYSFSGFFPSFISKYNEYLLVGADHYDNQFENSGKAFLYKFTNDKYELYQEFIPFDEKEDQLFGSSGAIDNNTILIGSPYDSTKSGIFSGSVYVYFKEDSLWPFNRKYVPIANSQFLSFGSSLTVNDNYVFVGTTGHPNYNLPGKVYIYNYYEPVLEFSQIIESGDNYFNDLFGGRLYANGDSILVCALFDTVRNEDCGAAYLFVNNDTGNWNKKYKLSPSDEVNTNGFSVSGVLTDDKIYLGAHQTRVNGVTMGSVFVYSSEPLPVREDGLQFSKEFSLSQNYPNPFNSSTVIGFYLPKEGKVTLKIFDITGRELCTAIEAIKSMGNHQFTIDLKGYATGIYFYRIEYFYEENNKFKRSFITKKAVLIK
jgi:hypothetical protein